MAGESDRTETDGGIEGATSPLLDLTDRQYWTGFVIVCLSLVSALLTYLLLTGLTPIAPRDEIVLGALFVNMVLIVAMIAVIAWHGLGMRRAWRELPSRRTARWCSRALR